MKYNIQDGFPGLLHLIRSIIVTTQMCGVMAICRELNTIKKQLQLRCVDAVSPIFEVQKTGIEGLI